jgi:hypothetical protein
MGVLVCAPKPQLRTRVQSNLVTHLLRRESICAGGYFRRLFSKLLRLPGSHRREAGQAEASRPPGTQGPRARLVSGPQGRQAQAGWGWRVGPRQCALGILEPARKSRALVRVCPSLGP